MPGTYSQLLLHVVFSTKRRTPWITTEVAERLYPYIGGILRADQGRLLAAGGMPDHIHLLVSLGRQMAIAEALRLIKANSSKWIHETFPDQRDFAWQTGYGAFSVSYSHLETVKRYIANQADHHRTNTFQEEFITFLERHGIEYDERYVWE